MLRTRHEQKVIDMSQTEDTKSPIARYGPLALIVIVAAVGAFALRDYLSFDALRDNREALLAFRTIISS